MEKGQVRAAFHNGTVCTPKSQERKVTAENIRVTLGQHDMLTLMCFC